MRTILLRMLVPMLLTSCAGDQLVPATGGDSARNDPEGSWVLVTSQPAIEVPDGVRVTLEVTDDDDAWQVGGTAACNSYGGRIVTEGDTWRSQGYDATELACDEPQMAAERAYLETLEAADTWRRPSADELVLSGEDTELRFEALPPAPTGQLTATSWVLDGLVTSTGDEASVSSPTSNADEATLRLDSDGTIEASTGCRTFAGEWTEISGEIVLTTFGVDDDSPNVAADGTTTCDDDSLQQEHHVLSVLGDGFRAEIDGQRLTLFSRDPLSLTYRADDD